ncbi:hypothetical protein DV736_g1664, partial [Chaetothyriales sp. CBS 134916]
MSSGAELLTTKHDGPARPGLPPPLSGISPGHAVYIERIRSRVLRDKGNSLYTSHNLQGLLQFFTSGRRDPSRDSPSPSRERADAFLWVLELKPIVPSLPLNIPFPEALSARYLPGATIGSHGLLLILCGYPSPRWLASIGSQFSVSEEVWRRHLDFLEPAPDAFSHPSLPSSSCLTVELCLTTVGTRGKLVPSNYNATIQQLRHEAKRVMASYREKLRFGSGWKTGDSIVRQYTVYDENYFTIEQKITVSLNLVDRRLNHWQALVCTDCGENLADSPLGPWLGPGNPPVVDAHTNLIPLHRQLRDAGNLEHQNPFPLDQVVEPHHGFAQNAAQLHLNYGKTLNHSTMCFSPFYAVSEVFTLVAIAESKFLNMLSQKLARDSANVLTDETTFDSSADDRNVSAQAELVRNREILDDHIQCLRNVLTFLRRQREMELWSNLVFSDVNQSIFRSAVMEIEHDFQHLQQRAEDLHGRCQSAMLTAMNSATIAESRRGLTQARSIFKFTVLASLYLPFSFASSFMGMNQMTTHTLKEDPSSLGDGVVIGELPDNKEYERRRRLLYPDGDPAIPLPEGFPAQTSTAAVWSGQNLSLQDLLIELSAADVAEVHEALGRFRAANLTANDMTKETFQLPQLGKKLERAAAEVTAGRGIVVLRGLHPHERLLEDNILIFTGIASYFGDKRGVQGVGNNFLVHLRDMGSKHVPDHQRPSPFANQYQAFHSDFCDVIGMYVIQNAIQGGRSHWASCGQIYNEIAATRPSLIKTLSDNVWPFQSSLRAHDVRPRPLLFKLGHTNQPYFCFSRTNLTGTPIVPRLPGPLQLTNELADALDAVHFAAEQHCLTAELQPGDLYFLNNHLVLHGREAFSDRIPERIRDGTEAEPSTESLAASDSSSSDSEGDTSGSRSDRSIDGGACSSTSLQSGPPVYTHERHKMRLWLRNTNARATDDIPELLRPRWREVFGEEALAKGKWMFGKVHEKSLVMASRNDEMQSFS